MSLILATLLCLQDDTLTLPESSQAVSRPGEGGDLVLNILRSGTFKISGKRMYVPAPDEEKPDLKKLDELFEARRQMEMYQETKGRDDFVTYTLVLRADRSTPFFYLQCAMMSAVQYGGVTRLAFVSQSEKALLYTLPKDKGLAPSQQPRPKTIRIVVCTEKDTGNHVDNKEKHDAALLKREREDRKTTAKDEYGPHLILADACRTWVEEKEIGDLYATRVCDAHAEDKLGADERAKVNAKTYAAIADRVAELLKAGKATVVLDADGAVPWEHAIGIVDACEKSKIRMEFVATPRYR